MSLANPVDAEVSGCTSHPVNVFPQVLFTYLLTYLNHWRIYGISYFVDL